MEGGCIKEAMHKIVHQIARMESWRAFQVVATERLSSCNQLRHYLQQENLEENHPGDALPGASFQ